ncbi:MAG: hypothetical protein BGO14_02325 [Chlamydiales bacterium 38-26]|nr:hypothetical protein [Chlamydiales bacterium]OJV08271.1 MAG: hypothetical protein BGO14_02325 [Chlamydiales bacterium 38-26]
MTAINHVKNYFADQTLPVKLCLIGGFVAGTTLTALAVHIISKIRSSGESQKINNKNVIEIKTEDLKELISQAVADHNKKKEEEETARLLNNSFSSASCPSTPTNKSSIYDSPQRDLGVLVYNRYLHGNEKYLRAIEIEQLHKQIQKLTQENAELKKNSWDYSSTSNSQQQTPAKEYMHGAHTPQESSTPAKEFFSPSVLEKKYGSL